MNTTTPVYLSDELVRRAEELESALTPIDVHAALHTDPPKADYVLPGLLAGTIGMIVAPGASGKSYLALDAALSVATGHDLTGGALTAETTGSVAYLAAEDPEIIIQYRLRALSQHIPSDVRELLAERLEVWPLAGMRPSIYANDDMTRVTEWRAWVARVASRCRLVLMDTLRRFHSGEENDSGQMAELLGVLEEIARHTGATIVLLHHTNKGAVLAGQGDAAQAIRGSSVLSDNVRWQLNLAGMNEKEAKEKGVDDDERRRYVRLTAAKANYLPGGNTEWWLERGEGGVLVPAHFEPPAPKATDTETSSNVVDFPQDQEHEVSHEWQPPY